MTASGIELASQPRSEDEAGGPNPSNRSGRARRRPSPPPIDTIRNRRVRRLLEAIPAGGSILDLGCVQHDTSKATNDDWVHAHCYRIGEEVLGIDYLEGEIERLAERGYNVQHANVETMALGRRFDTIVAGELIEHLSGVGAMLDRCHEHLRENGVLVLTTPNPWAFVHFRWALAGDVPCHEEHTCWFDERTLRQLLTRHGFVIERFEYVPATHHGITRTLSYLGFEHLGGTSLLVRARKN